MTDRLRDLPVPVSGEGAEEVGEEEVVQGVEVQLAEQELRDPPAPIMVDYDAENGEDEETGEANEEGRGRRRRSADALSKREPLIHNPYAYVCIYVCIFGPWVVRLPSPGPRVVRLPSLA